MLIKMIREGKECPGIPDSFSLRVNVNCISQKCIVRSFRGFFSSCKEKLISPVVQVLASSMTRSFLHLKFAE